MYSFHANRLTGFLDDLLLSQMHHWLEEVVVAPHLVVEHVESDSLYDGIEALVAEECTHQRGILLFHSGVVVLVKGATARELYTLDNVAPEAQQMVAEELTAIVGMDFEDWERQTAQM